MFVRTHIHTRTHKFTYKTLPLNLRVRKLVPLSLSSPLLGSDWFPDPCVGPVQLAGFASRGISEGSGRDTITSIAISRGMAAWVQASGILNLYSIESLQKAADAKCKWCGSPQQASCKVHARQT